MARIVRGPSVTLADEVFPAPPLMEEMVIAIEADPDATKADSDLIKLYAEATDPERALIDDTLRAICGYGLKTLMIQADADDDLFIAMGLDMEEEAHG